MPSDDDIQEAILEVVCDEFQQRPGMVALNGQSLVDDVTDELSGIGDDDVVYHMERLDDNRAIDYSPSIGGIGTVELEAGGIERYEQLSGETVVPQGDIEVILEELYNEEQDNPRTPALTRDELQNRTGLSDDELDMAVWYLKEKHYIDALTHIGTPWYSQAEITNIGRQVYEQI